MIFHYFELLPLYIDYYFIQLKLKKFIIYYQLIEYEEQDLMKLQLLIDDVLYIMDYQELYVDQL